MELSQDRADNETQVVGQKTRGDSCHQPIKGSRAGLFHIEDRDQDTQRRFDLTAQATGPGAELFGPGIAFGVFAGRRKDLDVAVVAEVVDLCRVVKGPVSKQDHIVRIFQEGGHHLAVVWGGWGQHPLVHDLGVGDGQIQTHPEEFGPSALHHAEILRSVGGSISAGSAIGANRNRSTVQKPAVILSVNQPPTAGEILTNLLGDHPQFTASGVELAFGQKRGEQVRVILPQEGKPQRFVTVPR